MIFNYEINVYNYYYFFRLKGNKCYTYIVSFLKEQVACIKKETQSFKDFSNILKFETRDCYKQITQTEDIDHVESESIYIVFSFFLSFY